MSQEVPYQQNSHNNTEVLLSNGREVKQFDFVDYTAHEKGVSEESSTTRSITEQAIGCKIIASRLHHLEQGQKKILRTIVSLQPIVQTDRMPHNKKGRNLMKFFELLNSCLYIYIYSFK